MTFTVRTFDDGVTKLVTCNTCSDTTQSRLDLVIRRYKATHDCPQRTTDKEPAA